LLGQGQAYAAAKDWTGAHQIIEKAIQLQPDLLISRQALIAVDMQAGRFQDVVAQGVAMQKRWPTKPIGYLAQAEGFSAQKDFTQAERILRAGLDKTDSPLVAMRLFGLLSAQKRGAEAERVAMTWSEHNPKDFLLAQYVGETGMREKDFAAATRWFKKAIKADPNNAMALNNLAWVLGQQQDPASLDYGQKALAIAPENPSILDTVGWLYVQAGDMPRGLELLGKASRLAPNAAPIQLNLAKALVKAGQGTAARPHLESLVKLPADSAVRQEAQKILGTL
jgi:tetratricopeptide (TPR) repeat protein